MAWETKRIKDIFTVYTGATPSSTNNAYWDGEINWITPADMCEAGYISKGNRNITIEGYESCGTNFLPKGSIVISTRAPIGKINITTEKLCTNQGCKSLVNEENNNKFFYYYLLGHSKQLASLGRGTTFFELSTDELKTFNIKTPPKTTQQKIADYLDVKTQNIDKRIELLQKKKEHYTILKKAIINEAVNGEGKNWETHRIKELFKVIGSGATPDSNTESYYDENGYFWLQTGDLNDGIITSTSKKITDSALKRYSTLKTYQRGSLVVAMYGATIGKIGLLDIDTTTNQACCVMSEPKNINTKFLFYWFLSNKNFIISLSTGGGQPNIGQDTIKFLIVSHPDINEQNAIVNFLDKKTSAIDSIIEKIKTEIDALKTYRRALINEAVTGKLNIE